MGSWRIFNYYIVSILLAFTCFHGSYHFGRFLSSYNIFCVMAFLCSLTFSLLRSVSPFFFFFSFFVVIEMFDNILCSMILSAANPFLIQYFSLYNPIILSPSISILFLFAVCVSIFSVRFFFLCI